MTDNATVSVVIINYHGIQDTKQCLQSIQKHRVVVVNISDAHEKSLEGEQLHTLFPEIDVVESKNLGFSGGNNVGAAFALKHHHPTHLLFLNNDTRVDEHVVDHLFHASAQDGNSLAVYSPKIYFEKGYEYHRTSYTENEKGKVLWYAGGFVDTKDIFGWHRGVDEVDLGQFDEQQSTQFATGCCMFMSVETYKKIGKWNERYFLYFEDMDYSRRVLKKRGKVIYVPSAKVWHKNAGSSGGSGSGIQQYYQTRNRMYYGMKYGSLRTKIALVKQMFHKYTKGDQITKKALFEGFLGRMGMRSIS